jgi:hypothetical protein
MKAAPWEEEFDAHFARLYRSVEVYEYEECTGEVKEFIEALLRSNTTMAEQHQPTMITVNGRPTKVQQQLTETRDTYIAVRTATGEDVYVPLSEIIEVFKRSLVSEIRHGRNDE